MEELEQYFEDHLWRRQTANHYSLILPNANKVDIILDREQGLAKREFYFSDNLNDVAMDSPFWTPEFVLYGLEDLMSRFKNYKRHFIK